MRSAARLALCIAGVAAILAPAAALAQPCLTQREVEAMVRYGMPLAVESASGRCVGRTESAYFSNQAPVLASRYYAQQDAQWPVAKAAFLKFANDDQAVAALSGLNDETFRPFLDAIVVEMIAAKMPLDDCGKIEKLLRSVEPLEPSELGTLLSAVVSVVEPENPPICKE